MNAIRKILGVIWIAIGVLVAYFGVTVFGLPKVTSGKQEDLVFGIIILVYSAANCSVRTFKVRHLRATRRI